MTTEREPRAAHSRQEKFWPGVALCALLLCAWMACTRGGTDARADNGGATTAGIIAMMGTIPNREHLYLIDTNTNRILMYESDAGGGMKLVSGRSYEADNIYLGKQPGQYLLFNNTLNPSNEKCGFYDKQVAELIGPTMKDAPKKSRP